MDGAEIELTSMNADELAQQFYEKGLSGKWISSARAKYLFDLAEDNNQVQIGLDNRRIARGIFHDNDGTTHFWSIYLSPLNQAGIFQVEHELSQDRQSEEVSNQYDASQEFINTLNIALDDGKITQEQYDFAINNYRKYQNPAINTKVMLLSVLLLFMLSIMGRRLS